MKNFTLIKSMMLACMLFVGMGAWADEATFSWAGSATDTKSADWSVTQNGVTIAFSKGTASNTPSPNKEGSIRLYTGTTMTITAPTDNVITNVTFTATSNTYNAENLSYSGNAISDNWTLGTPANSVLLNATAAARFKTIVVTFQSNSAPTLTSIAVSGTPTKTTYFEGESFDPAGLTVTGTYSDNNTKTVSTGIEWTVTPSSLAAGTTSVSVVASVGSIKSASYAVNGLTVNAIPEKTIAEFIAAEGGKCYLIGTVSNIANTKYGNFDLTDESGTIYVYGCLTSDGQSGQFSTLDVVAGDKIKVLANEYEVFNETKEAKNVIFVEEIEIPKAKYAVTIVAPENGTLVVKEGETVLTSGDEVEEGKVITVECTPADGYRYQNWQYKEDGNWITNTSTMTRTVTQAISIRANFEAIPTYTVAWSVNGKVVKSEDLLEGAAVTAPEVDDINDKVFVGWAATTSVDADEPEMVTPMTTATAAVTYYAVFATLEDEGEITYTKVTNNTFDTSAEYVLAAEESSTSSTLHYFSSYTGTTANESWGVTSTDVDDAIVFTLSGTADALVAEDASGNYLQALATGKFRMSSTSTTLTYKTDGTIYNPSSSNYNLRYNHNNGSGGFRWYSGTTGTSAYFYKKEGGATYSGYTTTVSAPAPLYGEVDFVATSGNDNYYATFSCDKDVIFDDSQDIDVRTVFVVEGEMVMTALEESLAEVTDKTVNEGWVSGYYVPANTGVLVYSIGNTPAKYYFVEDNGNNMLEDVDSDNMLRAASVAKEDDGSYIFYMLNYAAKNAYSTLGFYWGAENGGVFASREGGAYLAVPRAEAGLDGAAKGFAFTDAETDGIENVEAAATNNTVYNLAGQRVNANTKGIVIMNGKKYVVK